jgi:glycolate oxidase FAD binding subunit
MGSLPGAAIARAGSGVCYGYFTRSADATAWVKVASERGWTVVIEFAPEARKESLELWPNPAGNLRIMKRIKHQFDPRNLLNRGRLYRHI